jgi:hypothetical protein
MVIVTLFKTFLDASSIQVTGENAVWISSVCSVINSPTSNLFYSNGHDEWCARVNRASVENIRLHIPQAQTFHSRWLKSLFNDDVLEGIGKEMPLMYFLYKSTHSRKGAEDIHFRRQPWVQSPSSCIKSNSNILVVIKRYRMSYISLQFYTNDQLGELFYIFIYHTSLHVSIIIVLIIRRSNCINTSSSMISLCECECLVWLTGIPSSHLHRLIIPDYILIPFDLLMMSTMMLETCREVW